MADNFAAWQRHCVSDWSQSAALAWCLGYVHCRCLSADKRSIRWYLFSIHGRLEEALFQPVILSVAF